MSTDWFPQDKEELNDLLDSFVKEQKNEKEIHGIIVPHAGYEYSGEIAGKAYSLIDKKIKKAIILGPSHNFFLNYVATSNRDYWTTPLGKTRLFHSNFQRIQNVESEHSIFNQVPFLQFINSEIEIMPLIVGKIENIDAKKVAEEIAKELDDETILVVSTDLSHFLEYSDAVETDKKTIGIIEKLDFSKIKEIDACGNFPLMILFHICKMKKWKPKLIEYKNSGDVTGDKEKVVGYASFFF